MFKPKHYLPTCWLFVIAVVQESVERAVSGMAAHGLPPSTSPVYFGQLLGMSDHLTYVSSRLSCPHALLLYPL
jgi:hypothetical protein